VFGLDERIAAIESGEALLVVLAVAVLLGLRHATDPDHLTAVSTLVASEGDQTPRRAGVLGLSWGAGHATTLFLFGLPIVLFQSHLPDALRRAAEVAVGAVIMALAARLLLRWRRGYFHSHGHEHGGEKHAHAHMHDHAAATGHPSPHAHAHGAAKLGRSPLQAFTIGLVHGVGGSAGVGVLLLAAIPDHLEGAVALAVLAVFTGLSMAVCSTSFGYALSRGRVRRRVVAVTPALGVFSLAFGAWYALGALDAVPYYF
jgi:ABC-type nickel/cobalt efflux system permease component RcnA